MASYTTPYAPRETFRPGGRIADLILAQGNNQAEAERRRGDITGQAWAGVGNTIAGTIGQIAKYRQDAPRLAQEAEGRTIGIENARAEQAATRKTTEDRAVLGSAHAMASQRDPAAVKAQLAELGRGDLIPIFEKTWTDLESSRVGLKTKKAELAANEADYFGALAAGIKKAKLDPMAVDWALSEAETDGHDVTVLRQRLKQSPMMLEQLVDQLIEKSPAQRKMLGEEADRALSQKREDRALTQSQQVEADRRADNARADAAAAALEKDREADNRRADRTAAATAANAGATGAMWAKDADGTVKLMTPAEIRSRGASQPDTADMRNKSVGKKVAARAVDAVRGLGSRIITKIGPAQRADAIKRGAEAVWGTDPEFRTYQDSRMALAGTLAVEQQGSRVSDADVKALWLPMVPDAYRDTKESNALKWELIDLMRGGGGSDGKTPAAASPVGDRKRVTGPNGETGTVPKGSALPPGWTEAK